MSKALLRLCLRCWATFFRNKAVAWVRNVVCAGVVGGVCQAWAGGLAPEFSHEASKRTSGSSK